MIADIGLMIAVLGLWRMWAPDLGPKGHRIASVIATVFVVLLALDIILVGTVE